MEITPGQLSVYVALASCAVAGWNLYFHSKIREISALHRRLDSHMREYQEDRLEMVEKYATKSEVRSGLDKLEVHISALEKKIDRLLERGR